MEHTLQKRCNVAAIIILVAGLCSSVLIYFIADDRPDIDGAYQVIVVDGVPYPISPSNSKVYVREVQRVGGKAFVLFDEFNRWFAALWKGRKLAFTVAWISAALAVGVFAFGRYLRYESERDDGSDQGAG
ncbi:MAG: hypothetical protein HYY28_05485 [Betaproteobacteria bacterium]|nr:hypothetical protein [Betaproteobacteria bacterium]